MPNAVREGEVTEYEPKSRGPHRAKVGGKVVKAWPTVKDGDNDVPNPAVAVLAAGGTVRLEGYEKAESYNGRNWTGFYATYGEAIASQNGHSGGSQGVSGASWKDQEMITAQWAYGRAVDALGPVGFGANKEDSAKYFKLVKATAIWFFREADELAHPSPQEAAPAAAPEDADW